jgi:predicted nucleic acid-binding protein
MTLVDTSVWSAHFRRRDAALAKLLGDGQAAVHPWIIGELALGPGMKLELVDDLRALPCVPSVADGELLSFVLLHRLRGVGWVDAQLVLAAMQSGVSLWTHDAGLRRDAERLGVLPAPR